MREGLNFGEALEELKRGERLRRTGWNGKGMFVFLNLPSDIKVSEGRPLASAFDIGTPVHCSSYIMMKTADIDLTIVPWLASQTDILSEDWEVVK